MCQSEEDFNLWYYALKYVWDQIKTRNQPRNVELPHRCFHQQQGSMSSTSTPLGGGQSHGFANQNLGIPASRNLPGDCYIWGSPPGLHEELVKVNAPHLVPSSQKLDILEVSAGPMHFAAVTRSGHLYSWGAGTSGVLGLGSVQYLPTPTTIPDLNSVRSVSCGESCSAALTEEGGVFIWGTGLTGQLGLGNQILMQYHPKSLGFPQEVRIRQLCCGPYHSAAVSEAGGVYTWGDGFGGKLGHGSNNSEFHPRMVEALDGVLGVSCGYWHTAVWTRGHEGTPQVMYTWGGVSTWGGDHNKGCLGNGLKTGEFKPFKIGHSLESRSIIQVSCGLNLTVILTKEGEVYQMGSTGAEDTQVPWEGSLIPAKVEGPLKKTKIESLACGKQHIIAVGASSQDRRKHLFSWGVGKRGQLGLGSYKDHTSPQLVEDLSFRRILNVCCGGDYTLVVCSHDHKVAAANPSPSTEFLPALMTPESSPTGLQTNSRRPTRTSGGQIVNANQLKTPLKKTVLVHRDSMTGGGSFEQIPTIVSGGSVRKMKSEVFGNRLDRSRTGSTPLSDAQASSGDLKTTPGPRSMTPDDLQQSPEALDSDLGSSSDEEGSLANTDGQLTHDAYSEEDEMSSQGPRSDKSMNSIDQGLTKSISDSFKTPICSFPPSSIEDQPSRSPDNHPIQSSASSARLRSRQRGLERRLGIMDTWTSEQVISKHISAPVADLLDALHVGKGPVHQKLEYRKQRSFYEHRRSASAQNLMLQTLNEDDQETRELQKMKILNFGKFLKSIEQRLVKLGVSVSDGLTEELSNLPKLLGMEDQENGAEIGPFFEIQTIEKSQKILDRISDLLQTLNEESSTSNPVPLEEMKSRLSLFERTLSQIRILLLELRSLHCMGDPLEGPTDSIERLDSDQELLRHTNSGLTTSMVSNEAENENSTTSSGGQLVHLWMEKVDPGVSIVFQSTNGCTTKIKKIRFTKRMFAWDEAQRWWENNQERLIKQYGLDPGYDPLHDSNGEH